MTGGNPSTSDSDGGSINWRLYISAVAVFLGGVAVGYAKQYGIEFSSGVTDSLVSLLTRPLGIIAVAVVFLVVIVMQTLRDPGLEDTPRDNE